MNKQAILLPGVGNARELGGYRIKDQVIRRNVLLRTGTLVQAAPEAIELLSSTYKLQTVVDFRMSSEQRIVKDPEIPGAAYVHLPVFEMEDMMEGAAPEQLEFYKKNSGNRMALFEFCYENQLLDDQLYVQFLAFEKGKKAYRRFFELLTESEEGRAFLWHCADGKDRAGCGAMLLLFALGADRELVMQDYLLTNEFNAASLEGIRAKVAPLGMPEDKLNLLLFMSGGVQPEYMNSAIDFMIREYGSVLQYLEQELGVGRPMQEELKRRFLVTE
ncbi:MAG: tyrosine-protein phosphatase [Eubacterium sp.]|nr:tyrosine-protein phosphatase [Eubacterium sp.]